MRSSNQDFDIKVKSLKVGIIKSKLAASSKWICLDIDGSIPCTSSMYVVLEIATQGVRWVIEDIKYILDCRTFGIFDHPLNLELIIVTTIEGIPKHEY